MSCVNCRVPSVDGFSGFIRVNLKTGSPCKIHLDCTQQKLAVFLVFNLAESGGSDLPSATDLVSKGCKVIVVSVQVIYTSINPLSSFPRPTTTIHWDRYQ